MEHPEKDFTELPIYQKAMEIVSIITEITDLIPEDDDLLQSIKSNMLSDAMIIPAKIAGAEGGDIYSIRMQNAAIIRKSAMDLQVVQHSLEAFGFEHFDYMDIIRDRLEEFRLLFIAWVQSFDRWNYIVDEWGLFNPPGVSPFDHDPDDDLPGENFD